MAVLRALSTAPAVVLLALAADLSAAADELVLPSGSLERTQAVELTYRLSEPATGDGTIELIWTDLYDRLVEKSSSTFTLTDRTDVKLPLDLRRAVAMVNHVHAHTILVPRAGSEGREGDATLSFIARPADDGWSDYRIITWQSHEPQQDRMLNQLGVNGAMVEARKSGSPLDSSAIASPLRNDWRWYVENIATDFYSPYHRWFADHPVNWRFLKTKELHRRDPADRTAFMRDPSLSDPAWLAKIRARLAATVRAYAPYRPLYYSLADEPGIADLAAVWDFDLSPDSLAGFREWLKDQYGSVAALNRQWGADFTGWQQVEPRLTSDAMHRPDANFSAWADFKAWMDVAFARAIRSGTDAVHAADPGALAAIEGGQIPGWGGYDYSQLADAVDVLELYDYGDNVEVARSFAPQTIILTTSFRGGPQEAHRVWRELLRGTRGLVLWDEKNEFVRTDGSLGVRGQDAAPYFGEITSGLGALLIGSTRHTDPIAVLYSPASMRTLWMLDQKPRGAAWSDGNASAEYEDNAIRAATRHYLRTLEHVGLQPRFVSSDQIEHGELERAGYRVLVLPHSLALSVGAAAAIRRFVETGGTVVADSEPGQFDEHSRVQKTPLLSDLFGGPPRGPLIDRGVGQGRALYLSLDDEIRHPISLAAVQRFTPILREAGVEPMFPLVTESGGPVLDVESSIFRDGDVTILALQRDLDSGSLNERVMLRLPRPSFVYDVRQGRPIGRAARVVVALDPIAPTILAIADSALPRPIIDAPQVMHTGDTATIGFSFSSPQPAAAGVLGIVVMDPSGKAVPYYSRKVIARRGTASMLLPLAVNDAVGRWQIRVTDVLSGHEATVTLDVGPK
jgi:hypothetical protein